MEELVKDLKMANDNLYCANKMLEEENKKLKSIIKEVREYIEDNFYQSGGCVGGTDLPYSYIEELLEILEKENK